MLKNGNLKDFHVADLINIIGQSKKSGELRIKHSNNQSILYFSEGNLVDAIHGSLNGEEIIYEVITYESGEFDFVDINTTSENKINRDIDDLINEGSLRIDLINSLRKNSLVSKPNSIIKYLFSSDVLNESEKALYDKINKNQSISIVDLAKVSDLNIEDFTSTLKSLMEKKFISIQKSDEEMFWKSFQHIVNNLYIEFTSISGIKMTADLDKKIQDLISSDTWNLTFKDGKIYTNELFNFPVDEQWKIYDVFLNKLFDYFIKVYGNDFVDKVLNNLSNEYNLDVLLKKLKR
jgi:hypothetical protein